MPTAAPINQISHTSLEKASDLECIHLVNRNGGKVKCNTTIDPDDCDGGFLKGTNKFLYPVSMGVYQCVEPPPDGPNPFQSQLPKDKKDKFQFQQMLVKDAFGGGLANGVFACVDHNRQHIFSGLTAANQNDAYKMQDICRLNGGDMMKVTYKSQ